MRKDDEPKMPRVELATQEWVRLEIMTINKDIKDGFHEVEKSFRDVEKKFQNMEKSLARGLYDVKEEVSQAMASLTRWMFGLMLTTAFVIVAAVISQSL